MFLFSQSVWSICQKIKQILSCDRHLKCSLTPGHRSEETKPFRVCLFFSVESALDFVRWLDSTRESCTCRIIFSLHLRNWDIHVILLWCDSFCCSSERLPWWNRLVCYTNVMHKALWKKPLVLHLCLLMACHRRIIEARKVGWSRCLDLSRQRREREFKGKSLECFTGDRFQGWAKWAHVQTREILRKVHLYIVRCSFGHKCGEVSLREKMGLLSAVLCKIPQNRKMTTQRSVRQCGARRINSSSWTSTAWFPGPSEDFRSRIVCQNAVETFLGLWIVAWTQVSVSVLLLA